MSKISKKYFGPDQVDGSILRLEKDQAVRGKKQDGSEVSLFSLDVNDNPIVLGSRVALKSEIDSLESEFQSHLDDYSIEKGKISQLQTDMSSGQSSISFESNRAQQAEQALGGRLDIAEPKISQLQSDMDAAELSISNETLRAQGEESAIKGRLDLAEPKISQLQSDMDAAELSISNETLRAQGEESAIKGRLDLAEPKISQLQTDMDAAELSISNEVSRAQSAEQALDGRLDVVEPKVTQLESDVSELESYDLELRSDVDELESYGLDLRSDLDDEIAERIQQAQDNLEEALDYTDAQIAAIPAVDLSSYETISNVDSKDAAKLLEAKSYTDGLISTEQTARDAAISVAVIAEREARELFDGMFDANLNQEISDRQSADEQLSQQISSTASSLMGTINAVYTDLMAEVSTREQNDIANLAEAKAYTDAQVQAIVDGPSFGRFNGVVGATTSEFMLDKSVKGIMSCANGRVALHEGYDFTVSVDSVTGFSKLTFIGPSAAGGASEIESTDQIFVVYAF